MSKYLVILIAVFVGLIGSATPAHAITNCFGSSGGTDREEVMATTSRKAQIFVVSIPTEVISISFNVYGDPLAPGSALFHAQIVETTAGVPNTTVVAGTPVQTLVSSVPHGALGVEQAFRCGDIPSAQTFVFPSPVTLTIGETYALSIHETSTGSYGRIGSYTANGFGGAAGLAPGDGYSCSGGGGCPTWVINEFPGGSGINYDIMYSMETTLVDADQVFGGKIDNHIARFREYLQLGGTQGGLIFSLIGISLLFALMTIYHLPPLLTFGVSALLAGALTLGEIMPSWILMSVVAVGGISTVFLIANNNRNQGGSSGEL